MATGAFNRKSLDKIAAQIRKQDLLVAGAAAAYSGADLSRQPKLSFKTFEVKPTKAAVSPDSSYRLLVGALQSAKTSITAYVYNVSAGYLRELLRERKAAGVRVRVMVDANDPNDKASGEFKKLKALGIEVAAAPSTGKRNVFTVCHQKYVVVDGKTTVLASANWAQSAIPVVQQPGQYQPGNREWFIRFDDKPLAAWFEKLFDADLNIPDGTSSPTPVVAALTASLEATATFTPPGQLFDIHESKTVARVLPIISPVNYFAEVAAALKAAKQRIWIQQQYITAGDGVTDLLAIIKQRSKDADVRIIVSPKYASKWDQTVQTLRAAGLYSKLRAQNLAHVIHCHNKGVIVDDRCVVSSTNWSENSVTRAREAGVLIASADITGYFARVFQLDWDEATAPSQVAKATVAVMPSDMI